MKCTSLQSSLSVFRQARFLHVMPSLLQFKMHSLQLYPDRPISSTTLQFTPSMLIIDPTGYSVLKHSLFTIHTSFAIILCLKCLKSVCLIIYRPKRENVTERLFLPSSVIFRASSRCPAAAELHVRSILSANPLQACCLGSSSSLQGSAGLPI